MHRKLVLAILVVLPFAAKGTQDIDKPEDMLNILRMLLSASAVTDEMNKLTEQGCTWVSESAWAGAPIENEKQQMVYGVRVTLLYRTRDNLKRHLEYSVGFTRENGREKVAQITRVPERMEVVPECS